MRTLSTAALRSAFAENTDKVWLVLLTVTHADLPESIRVVRDYANITSNGNLFVAFPFEIELPDEDPDRPTQARLSIENVDRTIIRSLRAITSPCDVTIQLVLSDTPDTIEVEYVGMKLRNVQYDAGTITGELSFEDIMTEPVTLEMTPQWFPGLF